MKISIEFKLKALVLVILARQVAVLFRAIRSKSRARVVNPPDDIVIAGLLPDLCQVGGKIASGLFRSFADRMASHAADLMEQLISVRRIAALLLRNFSIES